MAFIKESITVLWIILLIKDPRSYSYQKRHVQEHGYSSSLALLDFAKYRLLSLKLYFLNTLLYEIHMDHEFGVF